MGMPRIPGSERGPRMAGDYADDIGEGLGSLSKTVERHMPVDMEKYAAFKAYLAGDRSLLERLKAKRSGGQPGGVAMPSPAAGMQPQMSREQVLSMLAGDEAASPMAAPTVPEPAHQIMGRVGPGSDQYGAQQPGMPGPDVMEPSGDYLHALGLDKPTMYRRGDPASARGAMIHTMPGVQAPQAPMVEPERAPGENAAGGKLGLSYRYAPEPEPYSEPPAAPQFSGGQPMADMNPARQPGSSAQLGAPPSLTAMELDQFTQMGTLEKGLAKSDSQRALDDYRMSLLELREAAAGRDQQRIQLAKQNFQLAQERLTMDQELKPGFLRVAQGNLRERGMAAYEKAAGELAPAYSELSDVITAADSDPEIRPPPTTFASRATADLLEKAQMFGLPQVIGQFLRFRGENVVTTPKQQQWLAQAKYAVQKFRRPEIGSQMTGNELQIINDITGENVGFDRFVMGLKLLKSSVRSRLMRAGRAHPEAAAVDEGLLGPLGGE